MCGIAGIYYPSGPSPEREEILRMRDALTHRGPDESGLYMDARMALGHRRLSIIDLSGGRQPISNEDQSIVVVLNGEIYNYRDLRSGLERRGHRFKTNSDTEVLVHLYEDHKEGLFRHLRGMFSFILWDKENRRVLAARDRFGEKPLVWAERNGGYLFASEIAAIRTVLPDAGGIDRLALWRYLSLQASIAPRTIWSGIHRLPAGHYLDITPEGHRVVRYWDLPSLPEAPIRDDRDAEDLLWERLVEAVRVQQISERPLGFFLSGGIDSTLVVAAAARAGIRPLKTYSVSFPGSRFDESKYAAQASARFGTEHHEITAEMNLRETLPRLMRSFGEPFGDSSCIPTYAVARAAREHVTVVLAGDGGDELAGGYRTYLPLRFVRGARLLPAGLRATLSRATAQLGNPAGRGRRDRMARVLSSLLRGSASESYASWRTRFGQAMAGEILNPDLFPTRDEVFEDGPFQVVARASDGKDPMEAARRADIRIQLAEVLLPKVDIAAMASALEVRLPFLDPVLFEWAEGNLPTSARIHGRTTKSILKRLVTRFFPKDFAHRPKMGFTPPLADWFRTGPEGDWTREILTSPEFRGRGWFRPEAVDEALRLHRSGASQFHEMLYLVLGAEIWAREDARVLEDARAGRGAQDR